MLVVIALALLGGETLFGFSVALIFGIGVGVYPRSTSRARWRCSQGHADGPRRREGSARRHGTPLTRRAVVLYPLGPKNAKGDGYVGAYVASDRRRRSARGRRVSARSTARAARRRGAVAAAALLQRGVAQRARPSDAPADLVLEGGVTPAAVTSATLELKIYDPNAASVAAYPRQAADAQQSARPGRTFVRAARGLQSKPPPQKVPNGQATDLPNLGRASARRRSRPRSAIARAMSISRDSRTSAGNARPVSRRAPGREARRRQLVRRRLRRGRASANSTLFLTSEFAVASCVGCRSTSRTSYDRLPGRSRT